MKSITTRIVRLLTVLFVIAPVAAKAGDGPYVVGGNEHILIGITLNEAAVRAALPSGLEPAEGITGGINVYTSKGGDGVAAYARTYVWVDLQGFDSVDGNKARYILWSATSTGPDKLKKVGYLEVQGDTSLSKKGNAVSGTLTVAGSTALTAAIELAEGPKCGPVVGSLNYPSQPDGAQGLVISQFTYLATGCAATPVAVELAVEKAHPLSAFKPEKLVWAAFAKDLSFSGSPMIPLKVAGK